MMKSVYASPLRVYTLLSLLALAGIIAGSSLPVSLFPNSSKPIVEAYVPYGSFTPAEFSNSYGLFLEEKLEWLSTSSASVEKLEAHYDQNAVTYKMEFKWGDQHKVAIREVESTVNSFASRFPDEIRNFIEVWPHHDNLGFLAASFFSPTRNLDETYAILEPLLRPLLAQVKDASHPTLWNPTEKEIRIELDPAKMANHQLLPKHVDQAIVAALTGYNGGMTTIGTKSVAIQMPRFAHDLRNFTQLTIPTLSGQPIHLGDVAKIDLALKSSSSMSFKTSGSPSLILWAKPRPEGNVKRMSEEIIAIVKSIIPTLPPDIEHKILVDPSEFIRSAIRNVFHEVALGALLAVGVLFIFIGSFRNTVTAAIEIPMSMVLAFLLMKFSGMNLNLISLGGLALSAGMNVDASVVVMENIFRHLELIPAEKVNRLDFREKLEIVSQAVKEVRFSVIASTLSSLVVFLPLAFTSELSYAILGDLAKTVVFSHGFSAIVALVLVPTVRLQLLSQGTYSPSHSYFEKWIVKLELFYSDQLKSFLSKTRLQLVTYTAILVALGLLAKGVLPKLPREIIGKPDTDWMVLDLSTNGNTLVKQMEQISEEYESRLLRQFHDKISYTFTEVYGPNSSNVLARISNREEMRTIWRALEREFPNTPTVRCQVIPWNPAELPIPDPPQLEISVRGSTAEARVLEAQRIFHLLEENKVFPQIWSEPSLITTDELVLKPYYDQWVQTGKNRTQTSHAFSPSDLADLARVATTGRRLGHVSSQNKRLDVMLRYPEGTIASVESLGAFPIGSQSKLLPLKALTELSLGKAPTPVYKQNQVEMIRIYGKRAQSDSTTDSTEALKRAKELISAPIPDATSPDEAISRPIVRFEDAERALNTALQQLYSAVGLSVLLLFVTLLLQFGSFASAALVLVSIPLGFIGVISSLWIFKSTLSLNSVLGMILLNGIAVANSIILVDFMKRTVAKGIDPVEAALIAGRKRLRPILITSLTTILGMLPVALGLGEGGKILQPLGIAVSGGLWVSMTLTLFVVPALQVSYFKLKAGK